MIVSAPTSDPVCTGQGLGENDVISQQRLCILGVPALNLE